MYDNRHKFPEYDQKTIQLVKQNTYGVISVTIAFIVLYVWLGSEKSIVAPILEWTTALYVINYYALLAFTNEYYDSIHPDFDLEKQSNTVWIIYFLQ